MIDITASGQKRMYNRWIRSVEQYREGIKCRRVIEIF